MPSQFNHTGLTAGRPVSSVRAWGDPIADIGWFCAKCWHFGAVENEAGGVAPWAPFDRGYERASGRRIDPATVQYWEIMAHLRWAAIAMQLADLHLVHGEPSLDLALTGHGRRTGACGAGRRRGPLWRIGKAGSDAAEVERALTRLDRRLAADIRAGAFDAAGPRRDALVAHLRAVTLVRLEISNPKALPAPTAT